MQKISVTLSVYHDGQFFTALFERTDARGYSVAKKVFGAKPSDIDVLEFVTDGYYRLAFSTSSDRQPRQSASIKNPKRRQRAAAKAMKSVGRSTKAQAALQAQHALQKANIKKKTAANKKAQDDMRFVRRAEKRRQKHRGH